MTLTTELILATLAAYVWPFARLSAMLMTMLVISSQSVPILVRMVYALAITAVIAPVLPPMPSADLFSLTGALITGQQVLVGIALGFISQMVVQAFILAGQIIALQTSLGFASMVDPLNGESTPVIGQFYLMLSTLVFFAMDGHLTMLQMLAQSFISLPVGVTGISPGGFRQLASMGSLLFATALSFALAATIALLIINFTFGIMTRAAPQLNIFSMGFAVAMICGLFIMWLSVGNFLPHFENHWQRTQQVMCDVIALPCGH